jgi:hypothetical protein
MSAPAANAALARRTASSKPDFRQIFVETNDRLVVEVAALFREALVFDMQAGHAAPLIFPHRARRIELVAVAGIRVGNDRHIHGGGNATSVVGHLGHGQKPVIRIAQRRRSPGAGHVDGTETGLDDRSRRYAIIGTGRDRQTAAPQQFPELPTSTHDLLRADAWLRTIPECGRALKLERARRL